jgi:serine/threonine protein kinase
VERISGTPDLRLGDRLGPYALESVLGEGAIGVVFEARHEDGTVVALKVLKKLLSQNEVYRQRFVREARVAQEVRHRHLVPIVDTAEARGYHYLAFAYVEGGSLEDRIAAEGPLALDECIRLVAEIASGLDALHAHGIVHRDVKPSNVMLDPHGRAALTDFGLAKGPAYTVLTKPGQVMGTLDYIAPELIRGDESGAPADVYALGCVIHECLAGVPPFADRRMFEIAVAHLEDEPPDVSTRRDDVPPALAEIVRRAMAKDPAERPRTGTAFAHLLRAAAAAR